MIPILFEHDETAFSTNGICRLVDCVSCKVTEVVNGVFECVFEYPMTGKHYSDIQEGRIIYTTHDHGKEPQPFDIYKRISPMNGVVTFYARHISYRLLNVILEPYTATAVQIAVAGLKDHSINDNDFTFQTTMLGGKRIQYVLPVSVRNAIGDDDNSILSTYGGEVEWDKFSVRHMTRRGQDTDVQLRYGKNIEDIRYDLDTTNTYNAVVPFWKSSDGKMLKMHTDKIIYVNDGNSEDIVLKAAVLDLSGEFDDVPSDARLRELALEKLNESMVPERNIDVRFYELWNSEEYKKYTQLQRVFLGDTVTVIYTQLGVNVSVRVVKTVYDSLMDRYESMELGKVEPSFSTSLANQIKDNIMKIAPTVDAMLAAIDHGTELIRGGLGGHVVLNTNEDGEPFEILILDTPDIATAVKVLRINQNGIGFSNNGYNGTYHTAWTLDGVFYADWITAGTLTANLMKAGILAPIVGYSFINMTTGEFKFGGENSDYISFIDDPDGHKFLDIKANSISIQGSGVATNTGVSNAISTAFDNYDPSDDLTQLKIFNILTNNGQAQGIYLHNGKLYLNFEYAQGQTLKLGGSNNGYGTLVIRSSNDIEIAKMDNTGLEFYENLSDAFHTWYSKINGGQLKFWMRHSTEGQKDCGAIFPSTDGLNNAKYFLSVCGLRDGVKIQALSGTSYVDVALFEKDGTSFQKPIKGATFSGGIVITNGGLDMSGGYLNITSGINNISIATQYDIVSSGNVYGQQFYPTSDRRLKKNIKPIEADIIDKLNVIQFDWVSSGKHMSGGLIAQEVKEICPELVEENRHTGYLGLDYTGLVPHLIKKVQEQQKEINNLKQDIANIKKALGI